MNWYETQIVGVIVGGLIAFCSNWFYRWNENRIERKKLKAGINSEVKVFSEFIAHSLQTIKKYGELLESSGTIPLSKITGDFEFFFIDSNMTKVGLLEKSIIKQVIELKGLKCALTEGLNILIGMIPSLKEQKIKKSTIENHLIAAENSIKKIQEISNKIIHLTS